jgi:dGTPase
VLAKLADGGFEHNEQSLRVVDCVEKEGKGLNLTYEVRDGILQHKSTGKPCTLEGVAVSLADRIAYINHDIEDAIRAGILKDEDLPEHEVKVLGKITKERINTAITDIYENSYGKDTVCMSSTVAQATKELRKFMFEKVYEISNRSIQDRAERLLTQLYAYFMAHPEKLPAPYPLILERDGKERAVCDYISGMTDKYAISVFESLFIPTTFSLGGLTI